MTFNRMDNQCRKCICYYTNWSDEVKEDCKEFAETIDCTHEQHTFEGKTPCRCFIPVEEDDG